MDNYYWDSFDCEIQCEEYYNDYYEDPMVWQSSAED